MSMHQIRCLFRYALGKMRGEDPVSVLPPKLQFNDLPIRGKLRLREALRFGVGLKQPDLSVLVEDKADV